MFLHLYKFKILHNQKIYSPWQPSDDNPKYVSIHISHLRPSMPILHGHCPVSVSQKLSAEPFKLHSHGGQFNVVLP